MRPAVKAALLSGLVWPGLGQAVLGRGRRGAVFALATAAGLVVLVVLLVRVSLAVLADLHALGAPLDMPTITAAVHEAAAGGATLAFRIALAGVAVVWLAGVVDAWRCGRQASGSAAR